MRQIIKALALLAGLLPTLAAAQTQIPTLPANTVLGRTGISAGPAQAIPFSMLGINAGPQAANTVMAGPATGAAANSTFRALVAADMTAMLGAISTWTAAQSYTDGTFVLLGLTSGSSTIKAPATGGGIATLFPGADTIVGAAATQTLTNKTFNCASNTCTVRIASDVTGFGTGVLTALTTALNASGGIPAPTPAAAGDIIYWSGTAWTKLAGNGGGIQVLSETTGVPSWTAAGTGTVTSVACGTGLSGGTFTTTGTCAVNLTTVTNSLGADVNLSVSANYFDGPSVAQGATGTWFASGTVTLADAASAAAIWCKLWDGTTVIASGALTGGTGLPIVGTSISLSGYLAAPAGNIRISCRDSNSTTGLIKFNATGNSKDSTISVVRIN